MNHIYRSVWNEHTGSFVAVSENAKSGGKKVSAGAGIVTGAGFALKALAGALLLAFGSTGYALPTGGTVVAGSAVVTSGNGSMTVNQTSQNVALNWQSFNIGASEAVRFVQPNSSSVALNRVIGADPSSILGSLSANGKVFLVNPNGILFGKGASVNVSGLVASTRNISDSDFMAGNYKFTGAGGGDILNQGTINADGGYVALLGAHVSNEGTISARLGTIALAAGNGITLDVVGDGLLNVAVNEGAVNALVQNGGMIQADGGHVLMTAQAAGNLLQTVVNNTGIVQAQTIENHNGVIKLLGDMQSGTVNVGGTLDASAPDGGDGGFIETSAAHVRVQDSAGITTLATDGNTGTWLIDPTDFIIAAGGGASTASSIGADTLSSNLSSSNVRIETVASGPENGDIHVNSVVSWSANELTLSAHGDININANLNASATARLALEFGQGAIAAGNSGKVITTNASVNLPASTSNFTTKQGSDGGVKAYTVITSLGAAGSTTATDLQGMNGNKAINYALGSNINASATSAWNAGAGFTPVGDGGSPFTGTFDGLGHTINGMFIDRSSTSSVGLFGRIGNTGEVRNVGLTGVKITGDAYVGGLAGYNDGGSISNSYVTGQIAGGSVYIAGLVGVHKGSIDKSYATATVTGSDLGTGGLVGYSIGSISNSYATGQVVGDGHYTGGLVAVNRGSISNSYATGTVNGGGHAVGGLVGINGQFAGDTGSIGNSYATGNVSGAQNDAGGLVGENYTSISNSYATGSVSSIGVDAGGLVGIQYNGAISQTYATGAVNGNGSVGGLVGRKNNGTVTGSYWDSYSTGQTVGVGTGLATGMTAITSDPSQSGAANYAFKKTAYADFDFTVGTGDWFMIDGSTRPFLQSEYSTTIHNSHQLQLMAMDLAAAYTLASDIDVGETGRAVNSAASADASGMWSNAGFAPIGSESTRFTGVLDGLGHTVSGLFINRTGSQHTGLFSYTAAGSTVRNIGLIGGGVASDSRYTGALVGVLGGSLVNSYATGVVIGVDDVGGLVGSSTGIIRNSYASGTVNGTWRTGGLVGINQGSVTESYATGTVTGSNEVGGLVGRNQSMVNKSFATGAVNGADAVGGLVGWNENNQTVSNSYATGAVTATNRRVGGLVGMNRPGAKVINSYATGVIQGNDAGGLVGWNDGNVSNSFWNTDVFAVGTNGASKFFTGMTGLSTAQMKVQANFTSATTANGNVNPGWDMSSTWVQYDTHTAPLLRSFMTALTVSANDATKTYDGLGTTGGNGVTYSTAPDMSKLLGAVRYSSDVNVGSSNLALGGLYSSQQGYLIDYVDGTMTIVPKALTVAGVTALDKVYDGTTFATLIGGTLTGLISGDTVTLIEAGTFATPNTGNGIAVTAAVSLGGASAGNYTVTQPTGLTANITAPINTAPVSGVDSNPRNQNAIASAVSLMSAMPLQDNMADAQWPSPQVGNDASMPVGLTGLNLSITGNGVKLPSACNEEMHATTGTDC